MIDCSIIIVNWNVKDFLRRCLASIKPAVGTYTIEVIVADNGSTDGSLEMLAHEFPWVQVMALGKNLGFARANNRALARAKGRYVLFLNPDTEIIGDAIATLIHAMDQHPDRAILAPQIVNPDLTFQEGSIRRDPTLASLVIILMKLQHAIASHPVLQHYYATDLRPDREQEIEQAMGAALFIRRDDLQRVGYFDEGYFLWFEEVDLCKRFRTAGLSIWYLPSARIIHHGAQSFSQRLPLAKQRIYNASVARYVRKHLGYGSLAVVYLTMPYNLLLVALYQLIQRYARR